MKKIVFLTLSSFLIYSCISKDNFILPINNTNLKDSTSLNSTDSSQVKDTITDHNSGSDTTIVLNSTCDPDSVYFQQTIYPLILSNCALSSCHDGTESPNYLIYTGIRKSVYLNNPSASQLYAIINLGRMPPAPLAQLNAVQKELILTWINQGALNNSCMEAVGSPNCDTLNISFSKTIIPIIQNYCLGCHNSKSKQNPILLESYDTILAQINNGKLLGSIQQLDGFIPMPSNNISLTPCDIEKFKLWIKNGAKND